MKRASAIRDYISQGPEQLSFNKGDRFYLLVETGISEKWYFVTTDISPSSTASESGFVPRDHISIQTDEVPFEESSQISTSRKTSTSSSLTHSRTSSGLTHSRTSSGPTHSRTSSGLTHSRSSSVNPTPPRLNRQSLHECLAQSRNNYPNVVATVVLNCPATKDWHLPVETGDVIRIVEDRGDHILAIASSDKPGSSRRLGIVPLTAVRFWNTTDGTPILKLSPQKWTQSGVGGGGGNGGANGVNGVPTLSGGDGKDDEPSYVRVIGYKRNRQSLIDYKISVTTVKNRTYVVRRSYSDFVSLHADIIGTVTDFSQAKSLPILPPSLTPEEERETAQRRGKALDMYIATIMALPVTPNRRLFVRKFLELDPPPPLQQPRLSESGTSSYLDVPMRPDGNRNRDSLDEKGQRISVDSAYRSRKTSTASDLNDSLPNTKEPPVPERWSEENPETDNYPIGKLPEYTDRFSINMSALIDSYSYSN